MVGGAKSEAEDLMGGTTKYTNVCVPKTCLSCEINTASLKK
jgi:hypothetical protein